MGVMEALNDIYRWEHLRSSSMRMHDTDLDIDRKCRTGISERLTQCQAFGRIVLAQ